jgi:tetratricopeptide (TPR) repeat protein
MPDDSDDRRDVALARAVAAIALRRYPEAIAAAGEALAADPASPQCHGRLVEALAGAERYEDALREVDVALAAGSEAGWTQWFLRLRALVLENLGRYDEALADAKRALALDPECDNAHYLCAVTLQSLGRVDDARAGAARAIALDPENPTYRRTLGRMWVDDDPRVAEEHYRAALALDPNDPETLTGLTAALDRQRRYDDALASAQAALRLDPNSAAIRRNVRVLVRRKRTWWPLLLATVVFLGVPAACLAGLAWLLRRHPLLLALEAVTGGALLAIVVAALISVWRERRAEIAALAPSLVDAYRNLVAERKERR